MKQKTLDKTMAKLGRNRYWKSINSAKEKGCESRATHGVRLVEGCLFEFITGIKDWVKHYKKKKVGPNHSALSYLELLNAEKLAVIASRICIDFAGSRQAYTSTIMRIGAGVEDEVRFSYLKKKEPILWSKLKKQVDRSTVYHRKRSIIILAMNRTEQGFEEWSHKVKLKVGAVLFDLFAETTGIVKLFNKSIGNKKIKSYIKFNHKVLSWIDEFHKYMENLYPIWMPTVDMPNEWTSPFLGGYNKEVIEGCTLVKTDSKEYLVNDLSQAYMPDIYESVNLLQGTKWRINRFVFHLFEKFVNFSEARAGFPSCETRPMPVKPIDIDTNEAARKLWKAQAKSVHELNISDRAKRVRLSRVQFLAKKFYNEDQFYFPYQLDFRGRSYCLSDFLNPQSDDLAKSLLEFSEGVPIIKQDEADWLALNGANLFGFDKVTLKQRIQWTNDNHDRIKECADDPINNNWWEEADNPWQFLAWCQEWSRFKVRGFGFITHLPVFVDGANSGTQILSMLMRDPVGAKYTNCSSSDTFYDFYQVIADDVNVELAKDKTCEMGKYWLDFGVTRKCTKRPVMIVPYGGKFFSTREYIEDWYKDECIKRKIDIVDLQLYFERIQYLARIVWACMQNNIKRPQEAMNWMTSCAKILIDNNIDVTWTTPLGFPVRQSYLSERLTEIMLTLGDKVKRTKKLYYYKANKNLRNKAKNVNGISPNYVHSLDASILHYGVVLAKKLGIKDIAVVHDSFGTHCTNMETLSAALRMAVVTLFKDNLLMKLKEDLESQLPNDIKLPDPPEMGTFDLNEVLESDYLFS